MTAEEQAAADAKAAEDKKAAELKADEARKADLNKEIERLKKKLADREAADEKEKQAQLAEQGKHKELADQYKSQIDLLTPELERLRAFEKQEREALIDKLPDDQKERWSKADLVLLKDHVAALQKESPNRIDKGADREPKTKWEDYAFDELGELKATNPTKHKALFDDWNKRRGVRIAY